MVLSVGEDMNGIYLITNKDNNKKYVGQYVTSFKKRMNGHKTDMSIKMYAIQNALNKYGWENFSREIIVESIDFTQEELDQLEDDYIEFFNTLDRKYGYNLREGGHTAKQTDESKEKISKHHRGRYKNKEIKNKKPSALKGIPKSVDHKKKIGDANRGGKSKSALIWEFKFEDPTVDPKIIIGAEYWCKIHGYNPTAVCNHLYKGLVNRAGIHGEFGAIVGVEKLGNNKEYPFSKEDLIKLLDEHKTLTAISIFLDKSISTISRYFKIKKVFNE
jgi:group I intron endonuclease